MPLPRHPRPGARPTTPACPSMPRSAPP